MLLIGVMYGPARAVTTVTAYITLGSLGMPVFANFASGWGVLGAPTAGYLAGMLVCAWIVGILSDRGWDRSTERLLLSLVIGNVVVYMFGAGWLGLSLGLSAASAVGLGALPFLAGDALKIAAVAAIRPAAGEIRRRRQRSSL